MLPQDRRKGIALIHLTFEGLQVGGGGVCTVNRGHLAALPRVKEALAGRGVALTPFFCETLYDPAVSGYDAGSRDEAQGALRAMGGDLYYLLNYSRTGRPCSCNWKGGEDFFGTAENTFAASVSGATLARNIARSFERAVVYCDDAAFVMAPLAGAMQANDDGVQWIWVVHSTSPTHDDRPLKPDKVGMESACVNAAREYPNIHLGAISAFIEDHLIKDYAAPADRIIPTGNGVHPLDEKYRLRAGGEIRRKIEAVNRTLPEEDRIPLDRPLVLSFGRPVPYKRLDLTLRAAVKEPGGRQPGSQHPGSHPTGPHPSGSDPSGPYHPVVVTLGDDPDLRGLRDRLGVKASIVNAFDFELVACLCQHEETLAVAILARNEPFGLIPSEARLLTRRTGGLLLVASDGGGLSEQVEDGIDGFVLDDVEGLTSLAKAVEKIRGLETGDAHGIRRRGVDKVFEGGYTWSARIVETLSRLDPQVAAVRGEVVREISEAEKTGL